MLWWLSNVIIVILVLKWTDITERAVPIHTAQGHKLSRISSMINYQETMLKKAGYRIILDKLPEESGIFAVKEGKISKSKLFLSWAAWLISTPSRQSRFVWSNLGRFQELNYCTEDSTLEQIEISEKLLLNSAIEQIEISKKLLFILWDVKVYDQGYLMNIQNVCPAWLGKVLLKTYPKPRTAQRNLFKR